MSTKLLIQTVAIATACTIVIVEWMAEGTLELRWLRLTFLPVLAANILVIVWDRWLWRSGLAQRTESTPRDLNGTWSGTLESLWNADGGLRLPQQTVYLVIRQTHSQIDVCLLTKESRSLAVNAHLHEKNGQAVLNYMYSNHPQVPVEDRSRAHQGAASLNITGKPATRLEGRYWTDRETRGQLIFSQRKAELAEDFESAQSFFSPSNASGLLPTVHTTDFSSSDEPSE